MCQHAVGVFGVDHVYCTGPNTVQYHNSCCSSSSLPGTSSNTETFHSVVDCIPPVPSLTGQRLYHEEVTVSGLHKDEKFLWEFWDIIWELFDSMQEFYDTMTYVGTGVRHRSMASLGIKLVAMATHTSYGTAKTEHIALHRPKPMCLDKFTELNGSARMSCYTERTRIRTEQSIHACTIHGKFRVEHFWMHCTHYTACETVFSLSIIMVSHVYLLVLRGR